VTLSRCATTGDPFYCNLIRRAPGTGSLFLGTQGFVIDTNLNTGSLEVSGVDIEANYRMDFADFGPTGFLAPFGGLSINFVGSILNDFLVETLPGDPSFDCAGYYGAVCTGSATPAGSPLNKYKHKMRVTWRTPWNLDASLSWRHLSSADVDSSSDEIVENGGEGGGVFKADQTLDAMDYIDLAAIWRARTGLSFRAGVNNVFDEDPPLVGQQNCPGTVCNGNTFPQVYDALGRYVFIGLTADF
jgi:outer membrane receptor protein involved in Fe transport